MNIPLEDRCEKIGKQLCAGHHYFNMYKVYYCHLAESRVQYMIFVFVFFAYMMINLNYIRRTYFIQHIQRLRRSLGLPDFVVESILVPVSYGVVPIIIRVIASYEEVNFHFQTGANIGACFALITLFTGLCVLKIGEPSLVDMEMFCLNTVFIILGNLLHLPLGFRKVINYIDSCTYIFIFCVYMVFRFYLSRKRQFRELHKKKVDIVEGRKAEKERSDSIMKGMRMITNLVLRVEAVRGDDGEADSGEVDVSSDSETNLSKMGLSKSKSQTRMRKNRRGGRGGIRRIVTSSERMKWNNTEWSRKRK